MNLIAFFLFLLCLEVVFVNLSVLFPPFTPLVFNPLSLDRRERRIEGRERKKLKGGRIQYKIMSGNVQTLTLLSIGVNLVRPSLFRFSEW